MAPSVTRLGWPALVLEASEVGGAGESRGARVTTRGRRLSKSVFTIRARQLGRLLCIGMLVSSLGCGHTTRLTYTVQARPERVFQKPIGAVPTDTANAWSHAQRVVLDLSPKCNEPAEMLRARCEHVEATLIEAIRRTGREVLVSKRSPQAALALAREHQAAFVVAVELPAYVWSASAIPSFSLQNIPDRALAGADEHCSAEVRSHLAGQATHLKASLAAQIQSTREGDLRWSYRDTLEGEAQIEPREIEASFEGREQDASDTRGETVVYDHHHHHDRSCRHRHGHGHDRDRDDDEAGKVLAAAVLTVLVVGIVILAASAARSDDARCTLLSVPEPSREHKQQLAERLDRLLAERLLSALQKSAAAAAAPVQ